MTAHVKDPFAKPYQIALCQHVQHGWMSVWELGNNKKAPADYVRISDPVTVRFQKVGNEEGIQEALQVINEMERAARNELNRKLSDFADRRASLLSLTHQPEVA